MFSIKNKIALAVAASAVCLSSGVTAQVDIDLATPAPTTFSEEFTASSGTPLVVNHAGVTSDITIAINTETLRYVRYDLSSGEFSGAPTLAVTEAAGPATAPSILLVEGGAGESFAIFSIETAAAATDEIDFGDALDLTANYSVEDSSTAVTATVGVYETQADASSAGAPLGSATDGVIFQWGPTLAVTAAATTVTAEVTTGFTNYIVDATDGTVGTTATVADLGDLTIAASGAINPNTAGGATATTAADIVDSAEIVITGDFTATTDGGDLDETNVTLGGVSPAAADISATEISITDADGVIALSTLLLTSDEEVAIPNASFTVAISWTEDGACACSVADASATLGTITRNGTNVDIPYITTFSDYNQRLIMVNRGTESADYVVTFTTEDGVTAASGTAASGNIPAGETVIVRMTDVVTLTGGTRTAGFVSIVAAPGNIDVATTQVNLSDASTDTVVLD